MGIARGVAFIITEGRYFDVSSALPPGWQLAGIPLDWTSPILMIGARAGVPDPDDTLSVGRAVFAHRRQRGGRAILRRVGRPRPGVGVSGVGGAGGRVGHRADDRAGPGQGRSRRWATSSTSSRRRSSAARACRAAADRCVGAVLGTLIFGVLRNALPQIPGATFYDRLIVGLVVIVDRGDGSAAAAPQRRERMKRIGVVLVLRRDRRPAARVLNRPDDAPAGCASR